MKPSILLVNPNTSETVTALLAAEARRVAEGRCDILAVGAPSGRIAIETPADIAVAGYAVVTTIRAHPGHDAAIIAAFGDPGLEAARSGRGKPVVGLGEAGLLAAGVDGRRFSIVTAGRAMEPAIRAKAAALGLSSRLASLRFIDVPVATLIADPAGHRHAILAAIAASWAIDKADAVLLGGAAFAGMAADLAEESGMVVLDGVLAAIDLALERLKI